MARKPRDQIQDWQLRERAGPASYTERSNRELLVHLFRCGEAADALLGAGTLPDLAHQPVATLARIAHVGRPRAEQFLAAVELGRRLLHERATLLGSRLSVERPEELYRLVAPLLTGRETERLVAVYLDGRHRVIEVQPIADGNLTGCSIHPREVFAPAVRLRAAAVAIAHNHPSQEAKPSSEDRALTTRLEEAAALLGIHLLDHLVVTDTGYYSFSQEGMVARKGGGR